MWQPEVPAFDAVHGLCRDLRRLWREAGGPTLRDLENEAGRGRSQLSRVLAGQVTRLPDWEVVACLVNSFREFAQTRGRSGQLTISTDIDRYWKPRFHGIEAQDQPKPAVPQQVPDPHPHFTGRLQELARLDTVLMAKGSRRPLILIHGMPGAGKSSLAIVWANRSAAKFTDGMIYLDLRQSCGTTSHDQTAGHLRDMLRVLCPPWTPLPETLAGLSSRLRQELRRRKLLVLLDNAEDVGQVLPLLPLAGTATLVVTSSSRMSALSAVTPVEPVHVVPLEPNESRAMLAARFGGQGAGPAAAMARILDHSAGLPSALALAACTPEAIADPRSQTLPAWLGEHIHTVFQRSYQALPPDAARVFRLLSLASGRDIAVSTIAHLAGLNWYDVSAAVSVLTEANLLTMGPRGRYHLHPRLAEYAADRAARHENPAEMATARQRLISHYLTSARDFSHGTRRRRQNHRHKHRLAWLADEHATLLDILDALVSGSQDRQAWQLVWHLASYLEKHGQWQRLYDVLTQASAAAHRLNSPNLQLTATRMLTHTATRLGRHRDAQQHLDHAQDLAKATRSPALRARVMHTAIWVNLQHHRYSDAIEIGQHVLASCRDMNLRTGQARAHNLLGWSHAQLGVYHTALQHSYQALAITNSPTILGHASDTAGLALLHQGHITESINQYRTAITQFARAGDRCAMAQTLLDLNGAHLANHDNHRAHLAASGYQRLLKHLSHQDATHVHRFTRQAN